jgi:hypothetical protein
VAAAPGLRLSGIESAIVAMQAPGTPWNCVFDVSTRHLDAERVRAACNAAAARHELATLAVVPDGRGGHHWVAPGLPLDVGEVPVVVCSSAADLDACRADLVDAGIDLRHPPLLRPLLARCGDHDVLLLAVSHVLADAVGMLRLVRSLAHAYAGSEDPAPAVDLAAAREVLRPAPGAAGLLDAAAGLVTLGLERAERCSRVAGVGADGTEVGSGVVRRSVPTARLIAARPAGATFDAHVMAATHVTVERWNAALGAPAERVGISQAWNLRPSAWWDDVVANLASLTTVATGPADRVGVRRALEVVGPALDHRVRAARARAVADAAGLGGALPAAIRASLAASTAADRFDTTAVSNFGVVAPLPPLEPGAACGLRATGMTAPVMGIALAVCSYDGATSFSFRYRRERFDHDGAGAFADLLVATVLGS